MDPRDERDVIAAQIKRPIRPIKSTRPPRPSGRIAARPQGPIWFQRVRKRRLAEGPGNPPEGFVTATTSAVEWIYYWAFAKVFNDPADPRQPPYYGGKLWGYQMAFAGGRRVPGGSVADFVVWFGAQTIVVRIQTERFHIFGSAKQQTYDAIQKTTIMQENPGAVVVDIYPQYALDDTSGQSAIIQVKSALGLIEQSNPITTGFARRQHNRIFT